MVHHRGLQAREREVELGRHRAREPDRVRVARRGETVDDGTARVAEAEEPCDLVERLARRVVDRLARDSIPAVILHHDEERVTAGDEEHDDRRLERRFLQPRRVQMRFQVVDADVRQVGRERQRLRRTHSDEEGAGEPGPVACRDRVDAVQVGSRFDERLLHDLVDELDVRATCDLRDDAAEARMEIHLAGHNGRSHDAAVVDDRGGGLVARRLDAEDAGRHQRSMTVSLGRPCSMPSSNDV